MRDFDQKALIDRIEAKMRERNWSGRELGRRAGISETAISQFQRRARGGARGEVNLSVPTLQAIAHALEVNFNWLITGEGSSKVVPPDLSPWTLAAMEFARANGLTDEQINDWYGQTPDSNTMHPAAAWDSIQKHLGRWAGDRPQHKPSNATDVTLIDIARRWPRRWLPRTFEIAQASQNHPTAWSEWEHAMDSWQQLSHGSSHPEHAQEHGVSHHKEEEPNGNGAAG
jgi:transcriptional regulator with XRE-family HTH domain